MNVFLFVSLSLFLSFPEIANFNFSRDTIKVGEQNNNNEKNTENVEKKYFAFFFQFPQNESSVT